MNRRWAIFLAFAAILTACGATDDHAGREQVVDLVKAGQLVPGEGYETLLLPDGLAHTSAGGEVVGINDAGTWTVVFFRTRGLNHYTGWIYSERELVDDPLGNTPSTLTEIEPSWWEVEAG